MAPRASSTAPIGGSTTHKEGRTILCVPKTSLTVTPPPKQPAFFNPAARLCRDLSILITHAWTRQLPGRIRVGDALAGVGARAIRLAVEVPAVADVYVNDLNPETIEYASRTAILNGVQSKCHLSNLEACTFLAEHSRRGSRFDFVDIDPFGSPSPYIDCGLRAVKDGGLLSVTATDSTVLSGLYPGIALRRYFGLPLRTDYSKEIGARLLTGLIAREAARLDLSTLPVFAHTDRVYTRVYARIKYGAEEANQSLNHLGYINHCYSCNARHTSTNPVGTCTCGSPMKSAGPLWIGGLQAEQLLQAIVESLPTDEQPAVRSVIERAIEETRMPASYFLLDKEASKSRMAPPRMRSVLETLRAEGYRASRTVFSSKGFRTDAPPHIIPKILQRASAS